MAPRCWSTVHPVLSALGFALVYAVVTALAVPVVWLLSLSAGALFGPWFGLPIAIASNVVGATIAMLAARYAIRGWVKARFPEAWARFDQGVARGGARFLFAARLTLVIPFALVNLAAGLTADADENLHARLGGRRPAADDRVCVRRRVPGRDPEPRGGAEPGAAPQARGPRRRAVRGARVGCWRKRRRRPSIA